MPTTKFERGTIRALSVLMMEIEFKRRSWLLFIELQLEVSQNVCWIRVLQVVLLNGLVGLSVLIGMARGAMIPVSMVKDMGCVPSAKENIAHSIPPIANLSSLPEDLEMLQTGYRVQEALLGPRSLGGEKRKAPESSGVGETAAPLPGPPPDVMNDPIILKALSEHKDLLKIQTPYDVDKLSSFLSFHPNRPFVESVLEGLKFGFWPCHTGDWLLNDSIFEDNYNMEDLDLDAVRAYRNKEVGAGRWSNSFSSFNPPMKLSPMFVVWQGESHKARVITDQTASGLNAGVPKADAHVRYDDM
ncbi:hypothetical protein EV360DRAFT_87980 [Lentinula raphanica]|nr:hypothetical protein EV360DRAFT_87980 [Lentinula raphanica]